MKKKNIQKPYTPQPHKGSSQLRLLKSNYIALFSLILISINIFIYYPAFDFGLTNWDDEGYILKNKLLSLDFPAWKAHFSSFIMGNYHPLTTLSLHADKQFWQNSEQGYHITNIILHCLNTLWVFLIFHSWKLTKNISHWIAIIFAIHPLHVESVSWVSERKDVLYAFFYLGAFYMQIQYFNGKISRITYGLSVFLLFMLSALSKGMAVTLPILLLLNLFIEGRLKQKKEVWVPVLLLIPALVTAYLAILAQQSSESIKTLVEQDIWMRPVFAMYALAQYTGRFIVPVHLSNFYPYPEFSFTSMGIPLGLVLITFAIIYFYRKRLPKPAIWGLCFFILHLAPVLQFLPVGEALFADRYMYIALCGLAVFILILWQNIPVKPVLKHLLLGSWLMVCIWIAKDRIQVWKNSLSLWSDMIHKYPDGYFVAYNNRAIAYKKEQKIQEALKDYNRAIGMFPGYYEALYNRGSLQADMQNHKDAIEDYTQALKVKPDFYTALYNRGNSYAASGNFDSAEKDYQAVVSLQPKHAEAWTNLGNVYGVKGKPEEAAFAFSKAIEIKPHNPHAYNNRALAYINLGDSLGALKDFEIAEKQHLKDDNKTAAEETRKNRIHVLGY